MDRNCDKCIHHTSGMCDSWECKMQTVEDVKREAREKATEEFAEALKEKLRKKQKQTWLVLAERNGYSRSIDLIDEISTELKGE